MKVNFDSNTYRQTCVPDDFSDKPYYQSFKLIDQAIIDGRIEPYISDTVFSIESINTKKRQEFFKAREPRIEVVEKEVTGYEIESSVSISSERELDFEGIPELEKYFKATVDLGFKIVKIPRLVGINNKFSKPHLFIPEDFWAYANNVSQIVGKIEDMGAGMSQLVEIGRKYHEDWHLGLKKAPDNEKNKIKKAVAEWADGDSVATSIAFKVDYFCTLDLARGAGGKSILSSQNLEWLEKEYGFKTISPDDLAKLI